jgi:hypothetical protein
MRKSFILHLDSLEVLDDLSIEQKASLFDAIRDYNLGKEVKLSGLMKAVFTPFKNQFNRDNDKYESIVERNSINGSKGGRPKKSKQNPKNPMGYLETQQNPTKPKKADNKNDNDNDNENKNDNDNLNDNKSDIPIYKIKIEDATPENYNEYQRIAIKFFWLFANYEKNKTFKDDISVVAKKAKLEAWTKEVKSLMENKGYTAKDFYKVFQYLPKDDFWMNTISSISALNKIDKNGNLRFATILIKANDWMMKPK